MLTLFENALRMSQEVHCANLMEELYARDIKRSADKEAAQGAIAALMRTALEGFEAKVQAAAERGERSVVMLSFPGDERVDAEHSCLYLVKGPRKAGTQHFLELGVLPFMHQLQIEVSPFRVQFRYDNAQNAIVASW